MTFQHPGSDQHAAAKAGAAIVSTHVGHTATRPDGTTHSVSKPAVAAHVARKLTAPASAADKVDSVTQEGSQDQPLVPAAAEGEPY